MSILHNVRAPENRPARMFFSAAAASLLLSTVATVAGPLGAQEAQSDQVAGCEVSFDFEDTRLINRDGARTAGPFEFAIDAGTYTVTVITSDTHDTFTGGAQLNERVHILLDSGYRSPATNDIPTDVNETTTVFNGQVIDDSATLSLEHAQIDGANSLTIESVTFTSETPEPCGVAADDEASVEVIQVNESTDPVVTETVFEVNVLPPCEFPEDDAEIDGFGYENGESCEVPRVVIETVQVNQTTNPVITETVVEVLDFPVCQFPEDDAVIDGFGYENGVSCEVPTTVIETIEVLESTNPTITEFVEATVLIPPCEFPEDDAEIDGFGFENGQTCEVPTVVIETVEVFESTNPTVTEFVEVVSAYPHCVNPEQVSEDGRFGWENGADCEIVQVNVESVTVFEATNPTRTEYVEVVSAYPHCVNPEQVSEDGRFGWENGADCEIVQVVTEFVEVFEATNPTEVVQVEVAAEVEEASADAGDEAPVEAPAEEVVETAAPTEAPICGPDALNPDGDEYGYIPGVDGAEGISCKILTEAPAEDAPALEDTSAPVEIAEEETPDEAAIEVEGITETAEVAVVPVVQEVITEVQGITETAPVQAADTSDEEPAIPVPVSTQVQGEVLALTGPSDVGRLLVMLSGVLFALGALCMRWGRLI